jgi:hypothetical protein
MHRKLSKTLIFIGLVGMVAFAGQFSGCDSSGYYSCYDYYGYNYYYCNSYIYDPFYSGYGYSTAYYGLLAPDEYAQADTTQAERTPEANVNVEHLIYIARTSEPTEDDLTPADFEQAYPCGQGDEALTVCADEDAAPDASDRIVIMFKTEGLIPLEDPVNHFILGFAFDADNDLSNNFVPEAAEAGDYFGHTDKWYKTTYTPSEGWKLEVLDASGATPVLVASHARLVIVENVVGIVIPVGEFAVPNPALRISVFRHSGDFGLGPDHDWSGLVYPKPGNPLIKPSIAPLEY